MIGDYLNQKITICNPTVDEFENVIWDFKVYDARVVNKKRTETINGESYVTNYKIFLPLDAVVRSNSRVFIGAIENPISGTGSPSLPDPVFMVRDIYAVRDFDSNHLEITA